MNRNSYALIVVPPLSPSDTNPPLGPGILRAELSGHGLSSRTLDLAIAFLRRFGASGHTRESRLVGDQDKDRRLTHTAREAFLELLPLSGHPIHVPDCVDPKLAMAYSFQQLRTAVEQAMQPGQALGDFVRGELGQFEVPAIVGISLMGPPQVFFSLLVAAISKELWPQVPVVAGGSHVTILQPQIASNSEYGRYVDAFLPHHCEGAFALACKQAASGDLRLAGPGILVAGDGGQVVPTAGPFNYLPHFDDDDLIHYGSLSATIPLQFTRSCPKSCPYCSYRAAEPQLPGDPQHACEVDRALDAIQHFYARGYRKFSFKDSLFLVRPMAALARGILARRLNIEWAATTLMKPEIASHAGLLHQSGLRTLEFGVESIHPQIQRIIGKSLPLSSVEQTVATLTAAGIGAVLNLIYGFPSETREQAESQLQWFRDREQEHDGLLSASHNLLEINRGAPFSGRRGAEVGIECQGIAPWAFSHAWNAPPWRAAFKETLQEHLMEKADG